MKLLGIDIGGSGMKAAVIDIVTGELVSERHRIPTPRPAEPNAVADVVRQLVEHFEWEGPVGCCMPTIVVKGMARSGSNLHPDWKGVQVNQLFSEVCGGLPFYIGNDADLAGMAEMTLGAGRGKDQMVVVVTIGTGLGSGVFYNGQLIPNFEFGRMFHTNGDLIEFYAGDAARKRDGLKVKEWAPRFDFFINHLNRICSPNHIIIGGGISKKFDKFKDLLKIDVPIEVAHFKNNAGIIGAAMFAFEGYYKMKYSDWKAEHDKIKFSQTKS
jgi:polyphosphate glucokinase